MSSYTTVRRTVWDEPSFRALSDRGQAFYLYLLTGTHVTILCGLSRLGEAAIAEARGWSVAETRRSIGELAKARLIVFDAEHRVMWLPSAITHDAPRSGKWIKGWERLWSDIPECRPKELAFPVLSAWAEAHFMDAYASIEMSSWGNRHKSGYSSGIVSMLIPASEKTRETPSPSPSPSPSPISSPEIASAISSTALRASEPDGSEVLLESSPEAEPMAAKEVPSKPSKVRALTWVQELGKEWEDHYQGLPAYSRIGAAMKPLVEKHGFEKVRLAWRSYLRQTEANYASPEKFSSTYGKWAGTAAPVVKGADANGLVWR